MISFVSHKQKTSPIDCDGEISNSKQQAGEPLWSTAVDLSMVIKMPKCAPNPRHQTYPSLGWAVGYTEVDKTTHVRMRGRHWFQIWGGSTLAPLQIDHAMEEIKHPWDLMLYTSIISHDMPTRIIPFSTLQPISYKKPNVFLSTPVSLVAWIRWSIMVIGKYALQPCKQLILWETFTLTLFWINCLLFSTLHNIDKA